MFASRASDLLVVETPSTKATSTDLVGQGSSLTSSRPPGDRLNCSRDDQLSLLGRYEGRRLFVGHIFQIIQSYILIAQSFSVFGVKQD